MGASLLAGVSGLRNHQRLLDVVANNLANINTPGFKASRIGFADLFSQTLDTGAAATQMIGGRNPTQLGMGVKTSDISTDFEQGSLAATGRVFDVAIEGEGFFSLTDGSQQYFTRVGSFDVDSENRLVHLGTGYRVQDIHGADIIIPRTVTLPGAPTRVVDIVGNLNAEAPGPIAEVMTTNAPLRTERAIMNSSMAGPYTLTDGATMTVFANRSTQPQIFTFNEADFDDISQATAQEVADVINATAFGFNAEVRDGRLKLVSGSTTSASGVQLAAGSADTAAALGLTTNLVTQTAYNGTDLRDLVSNVQDYVSGDIIRIVGSDYDGTSVSGEFIFGTDYDGTTVGDFISTVNAAYPGSTAAFTANGNITLTADSVGETNLFISFSDAPGNAGATTFANHSFDTTTYGGLGATRITSITVFDGMGGSHVMTLTFRKESSNEWSVTASIPESSGVMLKTRIDGIRFGEDGSFSQVIGTGEGSQGLEVRFDGIASPQHMTVNFGTSGGFDGLTQYGSPFSAAAIGQDGFGPGSLRTVSIRADGTIQGNFSNGIISDIAQLQIATFNNPPGLLKHGDNLYLAGANSGPPVSGAAMTGSAGRISASTLESSNVDIALEFTKLITAQRGFQVNARTITTTDQILQELANLIR